MASQPNRLSECDYPEVRCWLDWPKSEAAILQASGSAPEAFDRLEHAGLLIEAAELAAHALPKREAVWWACLCADETAPPDLPEADRLARAAAEQWLRYRTDLLRRIAMDQAEAAGCRTPEAWAAVAAFWSDGSLSPMGKPTVKPAGHLSGKAVFAAVRMSAARGAPLWETARLELFLARARRIAGGQAAPSGDPAPARPSVPDATVTVRRRDLVRSDPQ